VKAHQPVARPPGTGHCEHFPPIPAANIQTTNEVAKTIEQADRVAIVSPADFVRHHLWIGYLRNAGGGLREPVVQ
jgi:hypothetical protein